MIHFITPFSRFENLNYYLKNLENKNIIWHPIFHEEKFDYIKKINWIKPFVVYNIPENMYPNIYKLNTFINKE